MSEPLYIAGVDPIDGHVTHPPTILKKVGDVVQVQGRQLGKRRMAQLTADIARDYFDNSYLTNPPRLRLFQPQMVQELLDYSDVLERHAQRLTYPQWPANSYTHDEVAELGHS
jgi:hypothetical protein